MNNYNKLKVESTLLGPEDIERHASELAKSHLVGERAVIPKWLISGLSTSFLGILRVYKSLNEQIGRGAPSTPAVEWLLDNFYLIEEQVNDIRQNLSEKRRYFRLPLLKSEQKKGQPRIYAIALELVTNTDGCIDEKTVINFIKSYQGQRPLSMGELWALPEMLRIGLIARINLICSQIETYYQQKNQVQRIVQAVIQAIDSGEAEVKKIIDDHIGDRFEDNASFTELLVQTLRKKGKKTAAAVGYISEKLIEQGISLEDLLNWEHQVQAARQVSIGNAISSLRSIAAMDWIELFELLSYVEGLLRKDPAGYYDQMDFESRDYYRHVIEKISHVYQVCEIEVAEQVLSCAQAAMSENNREPEGHIGHYLVSTGRKKLDKQLVAKTGRAKTTGFFIKENPHLVYFGSITIIALAMITLFVGYSVGQGVLSPALLFLIGLVVFIPVSDIAINLVNAVISNLYPPSVIPKLELKSGITEQHSTMVIIPTLLPNRNRVKELLEKLEIYYLANKEAHLYFALVGDFKDACSPQTEEDQLILDTALKGISELNGRYSGTGTIFYYFHRQRQYNEAQNQWMGWERKRGAIIEFNDLLQGSKDTSFTVCSIDPEQVPFVKYVITLDADTSLSMGTAKRLVGAMAHPLNKPVVDSEKGVVVKGYGILQPRIGVGIDHANKTIFSRIFAGQGGIDPYTTAVSDVYQDLYDEGTFTGKGIYELATFQSVLKDAIPENSVLSHDLLEGSYLRAGLVTDIELIDGYPARYNAFSARLHRWVRGDWQLLPWLATKVQDKQGRWQRNPLSALAKWKIIDNLRRSLLNPAICLLIIMGFTILPGSSLAWLGLAVVTVTFPTITFLAGGVLARRYNFLEGTKQQTVITGVKSSLYQAVLQFIFVPYQAFLMLDAIIRTLGRLFLTRRNMLEWIPAADVEALLKNDLATFFKKMIIAPLTGGLILVFALARGNLTEFLFGSLVFGCWASAPYFAYRISRDYQRRVVHLRAEEGFELRRLARKTWTYFEEMVTAEDNYLPPDNFQVDPPNGLAHRTSPTNIGLLLVSTLTARDLGYLGTGEMIQRMRATLSTVEKLEKWEGHLYNWYDTLNLRVLKPRYVSTVDSGNLVGYLMVAEAGVREYLNKSVSDPVFAQGLLDTVRLYNEGLEDMAAYLDTNVLEEYIAAGDYSSESWAKTLETIWQQLTGKEQHQQVHNSPWGKRLVAMVESFKREINLATEVINHQGEDLIKRFRVLIQETKFAPLFDKKRQLFSIGYNVDEGVLTKSYYDLLASEARLASYIAIARGEVDRKHWFKLGRKLTRVGDSKGLVSWSGTMFEYFMPQLVMKNFENSLLDATYSFAVEAQKAYAKKRNLPWGISESAYYAFDVNLNYQYKAFGVPELGFKRGLGNELVVAPYATVLALSTDPKGALENIIRLKNEGMDGDYGLYEAIDYTPVRVALRGHSSIIKNFMVHHQGMTMLALVNFFNDNIMQKRFHAHQVVKSAELLLEERMPYKVSIVKEHKEEYQPLSRRMADEAENVVRSLGVPEGELPNIQLLSNGSYSVMVTDGGSGYSKNNDMAVARWRESLKGNNSGFFVFVQNINSNNVWSATYEPFNYAPEEYTVTFAPDKAEFRRIDGNIETHTQIVVSPEDNAEIRTVTLTNNSSHYRVVEVTSYLEAVLTHPDADLAHPAFSNLFVKTEFVPQYDCLLAVRRPRSAGQVPVFAVHTVAVEGEVVGSLQYETDRAKFIGRNRGLHNPVALDIDQPLSNTVGAVLDPILSLRRRIRLAPGQSTKVSYTLGTADNRKDALGLADKYRDFKVIERAFELAWNRSQIELGYLDIKPEDMDVYLNMVPSILFTGPARRKYEDVIIQNSKGQSCLWPFGISGDIPVVLLSIKDKEQIELVERLLKAHEFWRMKGLKVDLVFMAEDESGYVQPLQDSIKDAIFASLARDLMNRTGGVYILNANQMADEEKILLYAVARIILKGNGGSITEQLSWEKPTETDLPLPIKVKQSPEEAEQYRLTKTLQNELPQLLFNNGMGGFSEDGKEYIIHLKAGQHTPAPWINVIANPRFGFNITEAGAGYTWAENSRENKLTPWYNDPVTDLLGEVFYLRDESTGQFWSMTPMPVREEEDYIIRHGKGYTSFTHTSHGIEQQLTEFAALEDAVKICVVKLSNLSSAPREISVTYYMHPVLGVNEKVNAQYITTQSHGDNGMLLLTNSYNCDFPGRVAFIETSESTRTFTGDNNEFIGSNGSLHNPTAMVRETLSGTVGAGLVPCGAMQVKVVLEPEATKEVVFLLGQGQNLSEVMAIAANYNNVSGAHRELDRVKEFWEEKLEALQVSTPDKSMDVLLNSWLQYQVVACRLWSRAAFYQSGGAYGFRDQLQDVMAVTYTWPELTRKQILLHAAHQFKEGDVQHWWHPGANKGIRTRYSDDYLWLPYVTADYIQCTGDCSVLDEVVEFLEDEPLPVHEDERYNIPRISEEQDTVYVHCVRAIDNALRFGDHGIPLMGSGDWNDGMNTVGNKGKGESVWLGWFLYTVLRRFIPICIDSNDLQRAEKYGQIADTLAESIEQNAWDGSWYRRAYFDDGTPLGSAENAECKIDAIAQSWSVISGVGKLSRAIEAMGAVDNYLVDREAGVIKLLAPPFDEGDLQPGYIKSYIPGVRENGGQYTHAAVWTILAFAKLGQGDKVGELFKLINPINHSLTSMDAIRYKVEPYVVAADVYAVHPNTGRGGWSWYTGAAGWMYRVGIEHILGLKKVGATLHFDPCIPRDWSEFHCQYRLNQTLYRIHVQNPQRVNTGVKKVIVNGQETQDLYISLIDDGQKHNIEVIMGKVEESGMPRGKLVESNLPNRPVPLGKLPLSAQRASVKE